jgi:nicotinamidase-related amidase
MNRDRSKPREMIVGQPVLLVIDVQQGNFLPSPATSRLPLMPDRADRMRRVRGVIDAARAHDVPVIFLQEVHRANLIDFGRELDGSEGIHCVEGHPGTPIAAEEMGLLPTDYVIRKRRYSGFFGTDLEILLKALRAETLIMTGGFTDVCVHYTFVDGHQNDYFCRVVEDCVAGSSIAAHDASLVAMEYLQTGARRGSREIIAAFGQRTRRMAGSSAAE